jgi:hypothetical protein
MGFKPDNECKEQNIVDFTGLFMEPASKEITLESLFCTDRRRISI